MCFPKVFFYYSSYLAGSCAAWQGSDCLTGYISPALLAESCAAWQGSDCLTGYISLATFILYINKHNNVNIKIKAENPLHS